MSMELKWNKTDGKTEVLAEKHVVVAVNHNYIWPDILANVSFIYLTYYNYFNQIGTVQNLFYI
jgi:hypothetical protein